MITTETIHLWLNSLPWILGLMTGLWLISIPLRNVSIVDMFWGAGFVLAEAVYFLHLETTTIRDILLLVLVSLWGMRLSVHLAIRTWRKPEDFRYAGFRRKYGVKRYWWVSYFQTFLLQGILMWLISLTLAGAHATGKSSFGLPDILAGIVWLTGFIFEAGGDYQLQKFRSDAANKGKLLTTGFWKYTRHPNYFGDAAVWWGFGLFAIASGQWFTTAGALIMTFLLIRVSGVSLLEKTLRQTKPGYEAYMASTSAFLPFIKPSEKHYHESEE